jgi:glycosyltransferase involved in cell wall biosynthesis
LVSVIIPTYNRSALLSEAILSVYQQTYRPIECIVVDDGSTDDTFVLMKQVETLNNINFKLLYIVQQNAGVQAARNTGTAAATGEYIQYLDSDDLLYPTKLEEQVAYLKEHPECDAVYGDWLKGTRDDNELCQATLSVNLVKEILLLRAFISTFCILFRKNIIEKIGGWDEQIKRCQELDFQLKGIINGAKYEYLEGITGLLRHHTGDRIMSKIVVRDFLGFYRKWESILIHLGRFDEEIKSGIAGWYIYFTSLNKSQENKDLYQFIVEAIRLNPDLPFYHTLKMKILRFLFGKNIAIRIWVYYFRKSKD